MRYFAIFLMLASLTLFTLGCGGADQPSTDPSPAETVDDPSDPGVPEPPADEPEGDEEGEEEDGEEDGEEE